jgi:hypothetical protein
VITVSERSRPSSSGRNWVISLVVASTWVWPRTPRLVWSITASRCTGTRRGGRCRAGSCRRPRPPGVAGGRPAAAGWSVGWLLGGQPGADGTVESVGVDAGQHAAHGGLTRWPEGTGPRVAAHSERGQDLAGRVAGPLADGGQGSGAGQYRADRDAEHSDQWMASATPVAGVGDLGEVAEQVTVLVGGQRNGWSQPIGNHRNRG